MLFYASGCRSTGRVEYEGGESVGSPVTRCKCVNPVEKTPNMYMYVQVLNTAVCKKFSNAKRHRNKEQNKNY